MPDPLIELVAGRFRLLAEPMRIRILERLRPGERSVGELVAELGTTQQNISRHLNTLHGAGVLARRKDGNRVLYRIADPSVVALCETVCGGLERQVAALSRVVETVP